MGGLPAAGKKEMQNMNETQKYAYDATLARLRDAFPDNPQPYVSQVAKYFRCSMYTLLEDREFKRFTFPQNKTQKRISLENIAAWQCKTQ